MTREARNEIQIWSAIAMLAFGSGLSIAGFCVAPVGEISDSVLLVLAQCFIYAGSALGIDYYVKAKIEKEMRGPLKPPGGGHSSELEGGELRVER